MVMSVGHTCPTKLYMLRNSVTKIVYKQLGFNKIDSDIYFETMLITREKVQETLKKLAEKFPLTQANNNKQINLEEKLGKIHFKIFKKFFRKFH